MNAFCVAVDVEIVERKCKTHLNRRILTVFSADQGRLGSLASWRFTREDHAARHRLRIRPVHDLEQKARGRGAASLALHQKNRARFKCRTRSITALRIGSGHLDVMVPQWERADALARRLEERIEYRGRGHGNGRLAYAAPESTGRHDDRLDLGHLGRPHHLVAVEVLLLDASILHRALAQEQGGQSPHKRTGNLPLNLRWIDRIARISDANDAVDLDLVAVN